MLRCGLHGADVCTDVAVALSDKTSTAELLQWHRRSVCVCGGGLKCAKD